MSLSAESAAWVWAQGKPVSVIAAEIARLEAMPEWKGAEFDDARTRHMHRTRIATLRALLK